MKTLSPLRELHRQNRQAMLDALLQPTVNREALNVTRQSEMQLVDTASSKFVEAIADIADTLTQEQRTELVGYIARMHR